MLVRKGDGVHETSGRPEGGRHDGWSPAAAGRRHDEFGALRRLARHAAADLGLSWPSRARLAEVVGDVPPGVCQALVEAVRDGVVRVAGARFSADIGRSASSWYPLFVRSIGGHPRLSLRRAMQVVEYARLTRALLPLGWQVEVVGAPFDLVATRRGITWGIRLIEDESQIEALVLDVQRHGLAIDDEQPASTDSPLQLARSLHAGSFTHFSVLAPGVRWDHSLRHGDGCVVLRLDVAPC